jgi:hypothetical protein
VIVNVDASNTRAPDTQSRYYKSTRRGELQCNTNRGLQCPALTLNRSSRQNQQGFTGLGLHSRPGGPDRHLQNLSPITCRIHILLTALGTLYSVDLSGHKTCTNKFMQRESIPSFPSDHNSIKLKVNNSRH